MTPTEKQKRDSVLYERAVFELSKKYPIFFDNSSTCIHLEQFIIFPNSGDDEIDLANIKQQLESIALLQLGLQRLKENQK